MTAPIIVNRIAGHLVAAGPADVITAALHGARPLTITGARHATGETVWLAPRRQEVWRNDGVTVETTDLARTVEHPVHGTIHYAWIDPDRLDRAPSVAQAEREIRGFAAAAEARARAMVPSCDNCGDCRECV